MSCGCMNGYLLVSRDYFGSLNDVRGCSHNLKSSKSGGAKIMVPPLKWGLPSLWVLMFLGREGRQVSKKFENREHGCCGESDEGYQRCAEVAINL